MPELPGYRTISRIVINRYFMETTPVFKRILIANRGEIAVRIIQACRKLGIESVVYFSDADKNSLPVKLADYSISIEPPSSQSSYLNMENILTAAKMARVDAVHPGYGFLSENARFAELCEHNGIVFIGPSAESIRMMGDKAVARETMIQNGVPVIPGSRGVIDTFEDALRIATDIGYPVIVKAAAGGGGRGMRIAHDQIELSDAILCARAESNAAFGCGSVYLEKYFTSSRHIEFQILADSHGAIVHLGERDCSIQRRFQKLIEETPSPTISDTLRNSMSEAAVCAARAARYRNAGTVEFLVDEHDKFYFMEMNTRVQVEHPITEMITGIDIVAEQIHIAEGQALSVSQKDIAFSGHAIECRINAENPDRNFMPCPGTIRHISYPKGEGIRVDTHVFDGYRVPHHYDSLVAKVIVHDTHRSRAIQKMLTVLDRFHIDGIDTTIPFHKTILGDEMFWDGHIYTKFVEDRIEAANTTAQTAVTCIDEEPRQNEVLLETVRELMTA